MRTKRTFVPSSLGGMDRLEDRLVLSHAPVFSQGAAVLTAHAYNKSAGEIQKAFAHFAQHGQNYAQLNAALTTACSRIPFHKSSGLDDSMSGIVSQMKDDISNNVSKPVISAYQSAMSTLHDTVQSGVDDGSIVRR